MIFIIVVHISIAWLPEKEYKKQEYKKERRNDEPRSNREYFDRQWIPVLELEWLDWQPQNRARNKAT